MGGHKKMTGPDVFMATQIFSWGCHEHGYLEIHPPSPESTCSVLGEGCLGRSASALRDTCRRRVKAISHERSKYPRRPLLSWDCLLPGGSGALSWEHLLRGEPFRPRGRCGLVMARFSLATIFHVPGRLRSSQARVILGQQPE